MQHDYILSETKSSCFPYSHDTIGAVSFSTCFLPPHMVGPLVLFCSLLLLVFFKKVRNSCLLLIPFVCTVEMGIAQNLISPVSIQVLKGRLRSFLISSNLLATTLVV